MTEQFQDWLGAWSGVKRLWLSPEADELKSDAEATIRSIVKGKFLQFEYGWQMDGDDHQGLMIVPANVGEQEAHSVWLDSWHTRHDLMVCEAANLQGKISMMGTYHAPPDDDWGWRLELSMVNEGSMLVQMYNISPECDECLAVEMDLSRSG